MEPGMSQGLQLDLAAEAIAAAFVTQRGRAVLLKEYVCRCASGDLRWGVI